MYAYTYTYINTYTYRNYKELDVDGPVLCSPSKKTQAHGHPNPPALLPPSIPAPCNRARFRNLEIVDRTVASTRGGRTRRSSCPWQHTSLVEEAGSCRCTRRITHPGGTVIVWLTVVWIYSGFDREWYESLPVSSLQRPKTLARSSVWYIPFDRQHGGVRLFVIFL